MPRSRPSIWRLPWRICCPWGSARSPVPYRCNHRRSLDWQGRCGRGSPTGLNHRDGRRARTRKRLWQGNRRSSRSHNAGREQAEPCRRRRQYCKKETRRIVSLRLEICCLSWPWAIVFNRINLVKTRVICNHKRLHRCILLHHLPVFVDGPSFLSATQGYTTVPATRFLSCCLGSFESLFGISEIVRDHGDKATEQPCQPLSNTPKHVNDLIERPKNM